jgi:thiol:disulfide interchange protein DsbD
VVSAKEEGIPVIIDFYADWCIPCKELDQFTFKDPAVIALSEKFVRLKKDLTQYESDVRQRYKVAGVPTIIFIDMNGRELSELRLTGYEDAEQFLERMHKALP